jgi:hypothetical protein
MTAAEIQELFVEAASIDRRLPIQVRPAAVKSLSLPYVYDWSDKLQWGEERLAEERREFWENLSNRLNPNDVTLWERANELIRLVTDQGQRRCLLHWSIARAGGRPFAQWCRHDERIHEETGRRRKDRAVLAIIMQQTGVEMVSTRVDAFKALLPTEAEISDKSIIIEKSWMSEGAKPMACDFDTDLPGLEWVESQNRRRRERDRKRKVAA